MSEKTYPTPEAVVRAWLDYVYVKHDIEKAQQLMSDDAVLDECPHLPYGGVFRGPHILKELAEIAFQHVKDVGIWWINMPPGSPDSGLVAQGEYVFLYGAFFARSVRTNKEIMARLVEQHRVVKGKIVEIRPYYHNPLEVLEACMPS